MSIESKGFIADDSDVAKIAQSVFDSLNEGESGRRTYLKSLVATTQSELGSKPRIRSGTTKSKLDASGIEEQLKALTAVHERFYNIVTRVAAETLPAGQKDKAIEINRRTNFARTALYAVRMFVRAGHDITEIGVQSVTKQGLAVPGPRPEPPKATVLVRRAETQSKQLVSTLMALADTDRDSAIQEMQLVLGQLTDQLVQMGVSATKDAALSLSEHRPLKIGKLKTLFMPTATQVISQRARPS